VYGYAAGDVADPWKAYDVDVPLEWAPLVNDLTALNPGQGYWIRATEPITALIKGDTPPSLAHAPRGLTPTTAGQQLELPPTTYYGIAPAAALTSTLTVQAWVRGTLCGQAFTQEHALAGQSHAVFVIDVRAAGGGANAECGVPGQVVTLTFYDGARLVHSITTTWDNDRVHDLSIRVLLPFISMATTQLTMEGGGVEGIILHSTP
jgi:hypothetical protein